MADTDRAETCVARTHSRAAISAQQREKGKAPAINGRDV